MYLILTLFVSLNLGFTVDLLFFFICCEVESDKLIIRRLQCLTDIFFLKMKQPGTVDSPTLLRISERMQALTGRATSLDQTTLGLCVDIVNRMTQLHINNLSMPLFQEELVVNFSR